MIIVLLLLLLLTMMIVIPYRPYISLHVFFCINFRHQKQHHGSIGHILRRSKVLGAVAGSKLLLCRGW